MATESEVKFSVLQLNDLKEKLASQGATVLSPRCLEDNLILDTQEGTLASGRILLRLRKSGEQARLTVKTNPRVEKEMKIRDEFEVGVEDFALALKVLEALGYGVTFRYQKYRTIWALEGLHLFLDETPIGNYLEIEGESEEVYALADRLGFDRQAGVTVSYASLYRMSGRKGYMVFP